MVLSTISYKLSFKRDGYDSFIDFLKGICIIFILLNHCMPSRLQEITLFPLWGGSAVPIFLMIQVFHSYKHGYKSSKVNYSKLWHRIIKPFLLIEIAIVFLKVLELYFTNKSISSFLLSFYYGGGRGPGSYYPWVYMQFAVILPLVSFLFEKMNSKQLLIFFIIVSQVFEILFSLAHIPDWPYYSLLFVRYTFLIYLGYLMTTDSLLLNKYTLVVSVLSIFITFAFAYFPLNLIPFFRTNNFWKICHWPCYIFIPYILIGTLQSIHNNLSGRFVAFVKIVGKNSYEIFLFQLFYYMILAPIIRTILMSINNVYIEVFLYISLSLFICIFPVMYIQSSLLKAKSLKSFS